MEQFTRDEELAWVEVMNVTVNDIEIRWRWVRQFYRDAQLRNMCNECWMSTTVLFSLSLFIQPTVDVLHGQPSLIDQLPTRSLSHRRHTVLLNVGSHLTCASDLLIASVG